MLLLLLLQLLLITRPSSGILLFAPFDAVIVIWIWISPNIFVGIEIAAHGFSFSVLENSPNELLRCAEIQMSILIKKEVRFFLRYCAVVEDCKK